MFARSEALLGGEAMARLKAARVLVTHVHPLPEKEPQFEALARELPYPFAVARDNMTVTF